MTLITSHSLTLSAPFLMCMCSSLSPEDNLRLVFSQHGVVLSTKIQRDRMGNSKAYGFVSYTTAASAQNAIARMDGAIIEGKRITVRLKGPAPEHQGGNHNGNGNGKQSQQGYMHGNLNSMPMSQQQQRQSYQPQPPQQRAANNFSYPAAPVPSSLSPSNLSGGFSNDAVALYLSQLHLADSSSSLPVAPSSSSLTSSPSPRLLHLQQSPPQPLPSTHTHMQQSFHWQQGARQAHTHSYMNRQGNINNNNAINQVTTWANPPYQQMIESHQHQFNSQQQQQQ